jgi:hypothetical protein
LIEFAANAGLAAMTNPAVATSDTGSKSFTGSNPGDRYSAGLITSMLLAVSSSVWPSGFAFATNAVPMLPPAPGRLSTRNCRFITTDSFCAITRAIASLAPPVACGTMKVTGRFGYLSSADADTANMARPNNAGSHRGLIAGLSEDQDGLIVAGRLRVRSAVEPEGGRNRSCEAVVSGDAGLHRSSRRIGVGAASSATVGILTPQTQPIQAKPCNA